MKYYNANLIKDLDKISNLVYFNEWFLYVEEILLSDEFQKRKLFYHHDGSLWNHLVSVSYRSFLMAKYHFKKADPRVCAIAGLLHDFYPKAYKYSKELDDLDHFYVTDVKKKQPIHKMHAFSHAKDAANNSVKYFPYLIDDKIYSCIETHMFPMTPIPPKYIEGWIITFIDKKLSFKNIKEISYLPKVIYERFFEK